MSRTLRRCARALAALVIGCGVVALAAPPAPADPQVPFSQDVHARTHLAKSGMDITVPRGQFDGTIDLAIGQEAGTLTLPPATDQHVALPPEGQSAPPLVTATPAPETAPAPTTTTAAPPASSSGGGGLGQVLARLLGG